MANAKRIAKRVVKAVHVVEKSASERMLDAFDRTSKPLVEMTKTGDTFVGLQRLKRLSETAAGKQIIKGSQTTLKAAIESIQDEANDDD